MRNKRMDVSKATSSSASSKTVWLGALLACCLVACFETRSTDVAGGGGIETTDGQIIASTGSAAGAFIRMVPESYNPLAETSFPGILTAVADASGRFTLKGIAPGRYNLEAHGASDGSRLFLPGLELASTDHAVLPEVRLARPGKLRLLWEGSHYGYLFIPGTTIIHRILSAEIEAPAIVIDSLPAGVLPPFRWSLTKADTAGTTITDSIRITADSTTERTVFSAWTHRGVWHINTTAAGAKVPGTVAFFPMLIRLTAADFDFSQAAPDGSDLRFSNGDGSELPYQIDRWDVPAGRAEIWVKLPRVPGNDSSAAFLMHWGNAAAGPHSSGAAVFGGEAGDAAVWHLDEKANTSLGGYLDASPNGLHGTASALIVTPFTEAEIAGGLKLDGSQRVMLPDAAALDPATAVTASAWFNAASWKGGNKRIVQKGIGFSQYALAGYGEDSLEWRVVVAGAPYSLRTPAPPLGEWHQVAGTYDGKRSVLYLDGVEAVASDISGSMGISTDSLAIGHAPSGPDNQYFQGVLDEISIATMVRSGDWIKLAFETQRRGSKALRLEILK